MSKLTTCIYCHNSFNTPIFQCHRCSEGVWCSYRCKTNDNEHSAWCQLIRQAEREGDPNLETDDEEDVDNNYQTHQCQWLFRSDNNNIRWVCWCGQITYREPHKPWELLGRVKHNWSPYFKIAVQQKVDDMNEFIYFDSCKKEKPCNCINCLCVWNYETLEIDPSYLA